MEVEKYNAWNNLRNPENFNDFVRACRFSGKFWLKTKIKILDDILKILNKNDLIKNYHSFEDFVDHRFFKELYITDAIKGRWHKGNKLYQYILKKEIKKIKPTLILSFGGIAWSFLKKNIRRAPNKMEEVHGNIYKYSTTTYVIPIVHFSSQGRSKILKSKENYCKTFEINLEKSAKLKNLHITSI